MNPSQLLDIVFQAVVYIYQVRGIIVEDDTATAVDIAQEVMLEVMNRSSANRWLLAHTNSKYTQTDISYSSGTAPANHMQMPCHRPVAAAQQQQGAAMTDDGADEMVMIPAGAEEQSYPHMVGR